jgi:aminoglycoside 6'-N-acetyltransferase I
VRLVRAIERISAEAGALTMVLGTSDTTGTTSLANVDLYDDPMGHLARIAPRDHATQFWLRAGYKVVGVVPDAEGPGMPSITLARRL